MREPRRHQVELCDILIPAQLCKIAIRSTFNGLWGGHEVHAANDLSIECRWSFFVFFLFLGCSPKRCEEKWLKVTFGIMDFMFADLFRRPFRAATIDTRCRPNMFLVCVNKHHSTTTSTATVKYALCTECTRQCHRQVRRIWKMIVAGPLPRDMRSGSILLFSIVVKCKSLCHSFVLIYENDIHCVPYALCLMWRHGKYTQTVDTGTHTTQPLGYREIESRFAVSVCVCAREREPLHARKHLSL